MFTDLAIIVRYCRAIMDVKDLVDDEAAAESGDFLIYVLRHY